MNGLVKKTIQVRETEKPKIILKPSTANQTASQPNRLTTINKQPLQVVKK
jgi:hypothetical protein